MSARSFIKAMLRPTLNKKLIALMMLLNLLLIAMLVFIYYQTEKTMYNEFERQTADMLRAVQIGLERARLHGVSDEKRLHEYLSNLNLKGVTEVSLISNSDRILTSTNPDDVGKWITKNKKELIVKAQLGQPMTGDDKSYLIMMPVVLGEKKLGFLHLQVNTEHFSVFLQQSLIRRIIGASVIFAIGTLLTILLAQRYTRPIRKTVDVANRIADGDLDVTLDIGRNDEIGDLARSFNFMIERLREQQKMRERLRRTEHLASIGELAQVVAHEIKNPLNFISLSADHLSERVRREYPERSQEFTSMLDNMKSEVQRVSRFLQRFLELGKPIELNLRDTDMRTLVGQTFELVGSRAHAQGIRLVTQYEDAPVVSVDPELMKNCLYNIILNSFQSMPTGGTLTATLRSEGQKLLLMLTDTGAGLSEESLQKVFTPYFTTKSDGLGLGLALTKRIVEQHGGKIIIQSPAGKGASVTISLPQKKEPA